MRHYSRTIRTGCSRLLPHSLSRSFVLLIETCIKSRRSIQTSLPGTTVMGRYKRTKKYNYQGTASSTSKRADDERQSDFFLPAAQEQLKEYLIAYRDGCKQVCHGNGELKHTFDNQNLLRSTSLTLRPMHRRSEQINF